MQFLLVVKLVFSLLPLVIEAVRTVEAALPEGKMGVAKLQLVRQNLEAAYEAAEDAIVPFAQLWPVLEKSVNATVALFNAAGVFRK